ncbi:MAG: hypothetical protein A3J38_07090 [Gammaproteobacteria bacterium RIFCSPHIGHO2_12_FULL_45_9]|nr:MAG: hypothetical protein A3J38_07090 [Gammaproteobacteria bacterium RIFCSPHIGHO2_12_FULL_45_9]
MPKPTEVKEALLKALYKDIEFNQPIEEHLKALASEHMDTPDKLEPILYHAILVAAQFDKGNNFKHLYQFFLKTFEPVPYQLPPYLAKRAFGIAVKRGQIELINILLNPERFLSEPQIQNNVLDKWTASIEACKRQHVHLLKRLVPNEDTPITPDFLAQLILAATESEMDEGLKHILKVGENKIDPKHPNVTKAYDIALERAENFQACKTFPTLKSRFKQAPLASNNHAAPTPFTFHQAAKNGDIETLKIYLAEHTFLLNTLVDDSTALEKAIFHNRLPAIHMLLAKEELALHRDYENEDKGCRALWLAIKSGNDETVFSLLKRKDLRIDNHFGTKTLLYAATNNKVAVINALMKHPELNINGAIHNDDDFPHQQTALHCAARSGHTNVILELLSAESTRHAVKDASHQTFFAISTTEIHHDSRILLALIKKYKIARENNSHEYHNLFSRFFGGVSKTAKLAAVRFILNNINENGLLNLAAFENNPHSAALNNGELGKYFALLVNVSHGASPGSVANRHNPL